MLRPQQKRLTLAGLLFFCLPLAGSTQAKQKNAPSYGTPLSALDKQHFLNDNFVLVRTVSAIPKSVQAQILGVGMEGGMANPGQPFQVGDVIFKPLPFQRLIFAGTSAGYCFVYSEHGGFIHWTGVSLYRMSGTQATLVWRGSPQTLTNTPDLPQLRDAVSKGRFTSANLPKQPKASP